MRSFFEPAINDLLQKVKEQKDDLKKKGAKIDVSIIQLPSNSARATLTLDEHSSTWLWPWQPPPKSQLLYNEKADTLTETCPCWWVW